MPSFPAEEIDGILMGSDGAFGDLTKAEIETICCDCERPQRVIGQIFEMRKRKRGRG